MNIDFSDSQSAIALLKSGRNAPLPEVKQAEKSLDPSLHPVNDPMLRRDKQVETTDGTRLEREARIALPLQQLIIKRSVAFLFERKGVAEVTKTDGLTEDDVLMAVLDAGAEEVLDEGDVFTVVSAATDLPEIRKALDEAELEYNNDDPVFRPTMQVDLDLDGAKKFLKLADAVEELDDVQNVYSNANVSAEVIAQLEAE